VTIGGGTYSDPPVGGRALESLAGWFDGTPVRGDDVERPGAHGSFGTRAFRGARLVQMAVSELVSSPSEAAQAQRWFAALLADGEYADLTVTDPDEGTTSTRVRLESMPLIRWMPRSDAVRAQFEFFAPDPYRYGPLQTATTGFARDMSGLRFPLFVEGGVLTYGSPGNETGTVHVTNPGTAQAWPVFSVAGPVSDDGFEIVDVEGGSVLRFAAGVPAGESVVIDPAQGLVTLAGGDRRQSLTVRQWWSVPPGETRTVLFRPLGSATMAQVTVSLRSTFW